MVLKNFFTVFTENEVRESLFLLNSWAFYLFNLKLLIFIYTQTVHNFQSYSEKLTENHSLVASGLCGTLVFVTQVVKVIFFSINTGILLFSLKKNFGK